MRFLFLLFFGAGVVFFIPQEASALLCKDDPALDGYQKTDFSCDINYSDLGGSDLKTCQYRLYNVSSGYNTGWLPAPGPCSGGGQTLTVTIKVGADPKNCRDNGDNQCRLYGRAIDSSGNIFETPDATPIRSFKIDYIQPTVSANNASSQWFTSRTTTLSASDTGGSGLEARYSWDTNTMNSSCTSGGTTFTNGTNLPVAQGSHTLYLCARDGAGNAQNPTSFGPYQTDPIAPAQQSFIVNGTSCNGFSCPATVIVPSSVNITWSVSDTGGSGIQKYEVWRAPDAGGSPGTWLRIQDNAASPYTNTPPNNGTWWYGMHTLDNALHTDGTYNCITEAGDHCAGVSSDSLDDRTARGPIKVIFGDQTAPAISLDATPNPPSFVNRANTNASVAWSVTESGGGTLQRVELWRAWDANGDRVLQSSEWNNPGNGKTNPLYTKTSGFTSSTSDTNVSSPYIDTHPNDLETVYWYGLHALDNSNNTGYEPSPEQVQVDTKNPSAPILASPINNTVVTIARPTFDWNDAVDFSGISSYNIRENNTPNLNNLEIDTSTSNSFYASPVDLGEGNQYWWVRATDGAGNQGGDSSRGDFQINLNYPPDASFSCTPANCTVFTTQSLTLNNSSTDPDGSGDITRSEWDILNWGNSPDATCTSPALCNHTILPTTISSGTYTMRLMVRDNAGASDTYDRNFVIQADVTAPTISSFAISPTTWTNGNITVSFAASDSDSGIQEVEVWRALDSGGNPGTWVNIKDNASSPYVDSPAEGQWWYGIHAIDNTGNCIKEDTSQADKGHCGGVTSDGLDTRTDRGPLRAQVDRTAPPAPVNLSPVGLVTTDCIDFDWSDVTDISGIQTYRFQVDNNQNFNTPEINVSPPSSNYSSCTVAEGTQYWRSWAVNGVPLEGQPASVQIDHQPNVPPTASFNCTPGNCTAYNTETLTFNNNSSDPDNNIAESRWDILSFGSGAELTCPPNVPVLCNYTLQPISPNTYTMELRVQDSRGLSNTYARDFTVKRDIVAGFMCSLDNTNFVACSSLSGQISQGETLYLKDSSSLSEYTIVSEGASSVASRTWRINGSVFGGGIANPFITIPTSGITTLELDARDNQGRSDTQTHTLNPQLPFPEFQEISPF